MVATHTCITYPTAVARHLGACFPRAIAAPARRRSLGRADLVYAWEKNNVSTGKEVPPDAVTYPTRVGCAESARFEIRAACPSGCPDPNPYPLFE